eukprot:PITA_03940
MHSECSPFRPPNRTWESLMSEKIRADANRPKRTSRLSNEEASANVPVRSGSGEYMIQVDFGTADNCGENLGCQFEFSRGDNTEADALLPMDAIILGYQYVPYFSFGCADSLGDYTWTQPGLMGLGGGSLSLLNHPSTSELLGGMFSYCLPSSSASSGSFVLGKEAALNTPGLKFTTLIKDPSNPTIYFVNLMGISVGDTRISVPATNIGSGEGTILHSGTAITYLVDSVYMALTDAFQGQLPNLQPIPINELDTCYDFSSSSSSVDILTITLHLDNNVDFLLPNENVRLKVESGLSCSAFSRTNSRSIIGNAQQRNWRVVFDVPNSQVGFAREQCAALA